jgi:hypothetical protein
MKNKNQKTNELETDDEVLRLQGMREGTTKVGDFKLRRFVPGTIDIVQTNNTGKKGNFFTVAAFGFVHSVPLDEVLEIADDPTAFARAVRKWHIENFTTLEAQTELTEAVKAEFERINSAESTSDTTGESGN